MMMVVVVVVMTVSNVCGFCREFCRVLHVSVRSVYLQFFIFS